MTFSSPGRSASTWPGGPSEILTWDDRDVIAAFVSEIVPNWSVELNQTSADDSTIVVMPEGANDLLGPAFVLHRISGFVHLDQFHWDEYRKLGRFGKLDDALAAMRERLVPLSGPHTPGTGYRH